MHLEATASMFVHAGSRACGGDERTDVPMKPNRRSMTVADKRLSRLLRLGVLVLVIGVLAFAGIYYQDQHVDAGPSMIGRQIQGAELAVKQAPNNLTTRLQLAEAYRADKRLDDALKQYDEVLKAEKLNRTALLGRGGVLIDKGDLAAAALAYGKITAAARTGEFAGADPQLEEARYYLGSILLKQGKTKAAITELQGALKIDRTDSDALYLLGVAQLKAGSTKLAVDSLKKAVMFVPTGWCEPYSQLALAYGKLGNAPQKVYAGAMSDFCLKKPVAAKAELATLTKGPVAVDALLGLGLIAETESKNAEAITWYQKALTVDAKNVSAQSALSRLGGESKSPSPAAKSSSTTQGPS
jgi:tetratricopeptide (TPR) repeat protein